MAELDPRTPVVIGVAQLNDRSAANEPVDMMVRVSETAIADAGLAHRESIESVRVIGGIWPYLDPGTPVADALGLGSVATAITAIGGNEVYDLVAATADDIANNGLELALICSAETLRTRRTDRAADRDSTFIEERPDAAPSHCYGSDKPMLTDEERAAGLSSAVAFYAMAETAIRHRRGESVDAHRHRIAALWATGSEVAAQNPSAWMREAKTADAIATVHAGNRMVAAPYPKLMTSNINVDQAAAVLMCSAGKATALGIPRDRWVFPWSGAGASDHWHLTERWRLDESPAMDFTGSAVLDLAGVDVGDLAHLDLYSCFPAAVQLAQGYLGVEDRPFTITGGLTFFGGPLNSYCLHALARSVELLRGESGRALLTGNGGFFTKHSAAVVGSSPPPNGFRSTRVQDRVDREPRRSPAKADVSGGVLESYTVSFGTDGLPEVAALSVLDDGGCRTFATTRDGDTVTGLADQDWCQATVELERQEDGPTLGHLGPLRSGA